MQCYTEQEDRTDPLYMETGGPSCPQFLKEDTIPGIAEEEKDYSDTVEDQE